VTTAEAPATPPRPRGRPRSAAVEAAIFEAVFRMLERGSRLGDLSMDRIAQEAGVGKATLYRRWPNRDALLLDVVLRLDDDSEPQREAGAHPEAPGLPESCPEAAPAPVILPGPPRPRLAAAPASVTAGDTAAPASASAGDTAAPAAPAAPAPSFAAPEGGVREELIGLVEDFRRRGLARRSRGLLSLVVGEMMSSPQLYALYRERVVSRRKEALRRALARGVERGEIRDDVDLELLGQLVIGPILIRALLDDTSPLDDPGLPALIVDTALAGVAARRP